MTGAAIAALVWAGVVGGGAPPSVDGALAAIEARDLPRLAAALRDGLDVNATGGQFGESLLNNAILLGRPEAAAALIAAGADIDANTGAAGGLTPLCRAANVCDLATARLLLARGADVNRRSGGELSSTPLLSALSTSFRTYGDCYPVFQLIIEHGADVRAARGWFDGQRSDSALMVAAYRSDHRYVEQLLRRGADPNIGWSGRSALEIALESFPIVSNFDQARDGKDAAGSLTVLRLLVRAGARVDVKTKDGRSLIELVESRFAGASPTVVVDEQLRRQGTRTTGKDAARFYGDMKRQILVLLRGAPGKPPR